MLEAELSTGLDKTSAAAGVVCQIRGQLSGRIRRDLGKGPRAVAIVIDSQSVKAAETVSRTTRGYDAGKKINDRKRHLAVDTRGPPLMVMVTPADPPTCTMPQPPGKSSSTCA